MHEKSMSGWGKGLLILVVLALFSPLFTSAASCPNLYRNLSFGSRGQDVVELQTFLIAQGDLAAGNNTGYFGRMTESAVKKWQTRNGVVSSGTAATTGYGAVGPRTRAKIASVCGKGAEKTPSKPIEIGGEAPPNLASCSSAEAQQAIREKNVQLVVRCAARPITVDGGQGTIVDITHGPGMDCPAGCIYENTRALVFNAHVYDLQPDPDIRGLMGAGYGEWCGADWLYPIGTTNASKNVAVSLESTSGGVFNWSYHFYQYSTEDLIRKNLQKDFLVNDAIGQPTACIMNGTIKVTKQSSFGQRQGSEAIEGNVIGLQVTLRPLGDYQPRTVDTYIAACRQQGMSDPQCRSLVGRARNDISICDAINDPIYTKNVCQEDVMRTAQNIQVYTLIK